MMVTFWIAFTVTPGKMIFQAIIVDALTGETVTALRLVNRYLGYFLWIFAFGPRFLWIGFDRRKQGWQHNLANAVAVQKQRTHGRSPGLASSKSG